MADDDDEEEQPTKYGFSTESKLDEDHLFYLQFTNNFISNVTRPRDYDHCTKWLERLAGEPMYGIEAKRNRNMFLAQLLIAMQDNRIKGPFMSFPAPGPLPNAAVTFGLSVEGEGENTAMMFDEPDRELNMKDYKYESEDGRMYIATCALPNSSGVMGYIGLTFGGGEGLWLNKEGYPLKTEDVTGDEDTLPAVTTKTRIKKQWEMLKEYIDSLKEEGMDKVAEAAILKAEEAYKFLIDLPESRSDADLIEAGSYKFQRINRVFLLELYPPEMVELVQDLLIMSKKDIERRFRVRHNKLLTSFYEAYANEVEKGLIEYKKARIEWQTVFDVIAELQETLAEKKNMEQDSAIDTGEEMNRPTSVYINSLESAKTRAKVEYQQGAVLDAKKVDLHRVIHDRALFHMHEIKGLDGAVNKLTKEICKLRRENKKKQTVVKSLYMNLEAMRE